MMFTDYQDMELQCCKGTNICTTPVWLCKSVLECLYLTQSTITWLDTSAWIEGFNWNVKYLQAPSVSA